MGSQSDWEVMKEAKDQLDEFSISNEQLIILLTEHLIEF